VSNLKGAVRLLCEHCTPVFQDDEADRSLYATGINLTGLTCGEIARLRCFGMSQLLSPSPANGSVRSKMLFGRAQEANRYVEMFLGGEN